MSSEEEEEAYFNKRLESEDSDISGEGTITTFSGFFYRPFISVLFEERLILGFFVEEIDEPVLGLPAESDEDEEDQRPLQRKTRKDYYDGDDNDEEELAEAIRLQELQARRLKAEDFLDYCQEEEDDDASDTNVGIMAAEQAKEDEQRFRTEVVTLASSLEKELAQLVTKISLVRKLSKPDGGDSDADGTRQEVLEFLEAKNRLFSAYQACLVFVMYLKVSGRSIAEHPVNDHLIKYRVMMDKFRQLEKSLRYKIEKAATKVTDPDLAVRPNVEDILPDKVLPKADGEVLYRPPKLTRMAYTEGSRGKRRRSVDSAAESMVTVDEPDQIMDGQVADQVLLDRERYEEENMTRLLETREIKKRQRKAAGPLDDVEVHKRRKAEYVLHIC